MIHITTEISRYARELVREDQLLSQLTDAFKSTVREAVLRNDKEADQVADELFNVLGYVEMRLILRAYLRGDGAEALRLFSAHIERAINKTAELHAEQELPDAISRDARNREEAMAARIYG